MVTVRAIEPPRWQPVFPILLITTARQEADALPPLIAQHCGIEHQAVETGLQYSERLVYRIIRLPFL